MNKIEQILDKYLQDKSNMDIDKYQEMVTPDEVEFDKGLIEAGIIATLRMLKNENTDNKI